MTALFLSLQQRKIPRFCRGNKRFGKNQTCRATANHKNAEKRLSHSAYRCQHHIVFTPKLIRKEIYGKPKKDIGEIIRNLCEQEGVEITEAESYKIGNRNLIDMDQLYDYSSGKNHS